MPFSQALLKMRSLKNILLLHTYSNTIDDYNLVLKQRFRLFRTVTLISLFVYIAFLIQISVVLPGNILILSLMIVLFIAAFANYFALAWHKNERVSFIITIGIWFILIHVDTYYSGGIKNSVNFYLAALIITAYMLTGSLGGKIMTALAILHLAYFFIIGKYTNWISYSFMGDRPALINLYYFVTTSISMFILAFQSGYIERNKNEVINAIKHSKNELELKNLELQQSEATLALKNKELERKNKELEQFAYVASHDLQEPIRTAAGFAELLQRQFKGRLDEKADQYLAFIVDSSERMKVLIKELLNYSRIGFEEKRVSIDCNLVIKELMADLGQTIIETGAVITYDSLPVISGYTVAIKQLFQNLVLNGIKFRKENQVPEIKIMGKQEGNYWHFTVTDNGIGIAREYFERIFIIFQRLHTRSKYEGSGIGLSHCKKIVELHNGKIWVESNVGEGATFHFTIS